MDLSDAAAIASVVSAIVAVVMLVLGLAQRKRLIEPDDAAHAQRPRITADPSAVPGAPFTPSHWVTRPTQPSGQSAAISDGLPSLASIPIRQPRRRKGWIVAGVVLLVSALAVLGLVQSGAWQSDSDWRGDVTLTLGQEVDLDASPPDVGTLSGLRADIAWQSQLAGIAKGFIFTPTTAGYLARWPAKSDPRDRDCLELLRTSPAELVEELSPGDRICVGTVDSAGSANRVALIRIVSIDVHTLVLSVTHWRLAYTYSTPA